MTVTTAWLRTVAGAGVPVADMLTGLHAETGLTQSGPGFVLLHRQAGCPTAPGTVPFTLDRTELEFQPLGACITCHGTRAGDTLDETLGALGRAAVALHRVAYQMSRAGQMLDEPPTPAGLAAASDMLCGARADLDPALRPDGLSQLTVLAGDLPAWLATGMVTYRTQAQAQLTALLTAYAANDVIGAIAAAEARRIIAFRAHVDPRGEHYVAVVGPARELTTRQVPRLVREALLVHTPVVWLNRADGGIALYQLPGHLAGLLLVSGAFTRDGGPVLAGDTDEVLTAAAAMSDGCDQNAPLADPRVALCAARDLLAA
jgi:hypothetical protein